MVKFAVMSDLHSELIHDADRRVKIFVEEVNRENCDFAMNLGDFMQPEYIGSYSCRTGKVTAFMENVLQGKGISPEEKRAIKRELYDLHCPLYYALGNHDLDLYSKEEIMQYWGMKSSYYSFDFGGYHFIVLDTNFGVEDGKAIEFSRGNYMNWFFQKNEPFPYIPKAQLKWLKDDLDAADRPSVVFSHEGINGGFLNAINHEEIFHILKEAPKGVRLCICGHKHEDLLEEECGIPVYFVNSMSGYSVPAQYAVHRFPEEVEAKHPNVQYICPYEDPLFVIVTMDENRIEIKGRKSRFLPPSPEVLCPEFGRGKIKFSAECSDVIL